MKTNAMQVKDIHDYNANVRCCLELKNFLPELVVKALVLSLAILVVIINYIVYTFLHSVLHFVLKFDFQM